MSSWKECKLGDICTDISYGYTASAKSENVGPKFLRITDIVPDRITWGNVPFCEIDDKKKEQYKLEVGDIVIARTGATTGYNKVIKDDIDSVFASYLIRYKIDKQQAFPAFIGYSLQSYEWKGFVEGIIGGSAQPGANAKQFASYDILLPPLEEQKAIAEVLSSFDDKIDLLHRQNQTLESLAQTLFRQWFIEEAKEKWEIGTFDDLVEVSSGKSLKRELFDDMGKYEVLGANGKIGKTNEWLFEEKLIYTGRVGTLGNVFLIDEDKKVWLSDNTLVVKPKKYFYFIYFLMIDFQLENLNVGSTQPLVRQSDLKNIEILLPNDEIVLRFEQQSKNIFKKINQNKKQIQTLENLRDTLLPNLLSGEVRVKI
ncbi:restriction endonuclease subunit S [Aliarcobacter butzleri]|uniref:restriction endonuclease subunit S n=1 Tax=Aliarcobacter butzleri TaxID=28197 RepID=UPI002B255DA3|nr:restriction endonuclease subunit S [Aliarcobacter butzleri]